MDDYVSIPSKRLFELVKKYLHHKRLKDIHGKEAYFGFVYFKAVLIYFINLQKKLESLFKMQDASSIENNSTSEFLEKMNELQERVN